ncbi:MAG TPA: ribosome maturation factor RimM [Bacteroidales bacterium]|nr:ribosome maturation factor RimM [Bacteroidales bacterium]
MIRAKDVFSIGKLHKPHGISGEVSFGFTNDVFDHTECPYWILEMDGILVPFYVESYRFKSSETVLVKFENIDTEARVRELSGKEVYYPVKFADKIETSQDNWNFYIGFAVFDEQAGYIGEITDVDDSTLNVLFTLSKDDHDLLMPVAEEFFTEIDIENREMHVSLPEGLLDL